MRQRYSPTSGTGITALQATAGNRTAARLVQRAGPDDDEAPNLYSQAQAPTYAQAPNLYSQAQAPPYAQAPNLYSQAQTPTYAQAPNLYSQAESGGDSADRGRGAAGPAPRAARSPGYDPAKVVKAPTEDSRGNDLRWAGAVPGGRSYKKTWKQTGHGRYKAGWEEQGPTASGGGLRSKLPQEKYQGEDKALGWRGPQAKEGDSPQQAARKAGIRSQDWYTTRYESDPANTARELSGAGFPGLADQTHGFVQNPQGGFHTFDPQRVDVSAGGTGPSTPQRGFGLSLNEHRAAGNKIKTTHHTTPLAGGAVAAAGMLTTRGGKVGQISDESGHYIPEGEYVNQAVGALSKANAFEGGAGTYKKQVKLTGYSASTGQGKGWVGANPEYHQGDLELPADAFSQSTGNERQMRLKATVNERIRSSVPKTARNRPGPAAQSAIDAARSGKEAAEAAQERADLEDRVFEGAAYDPAESALYPSDVYAEPDTYLQDEAED